MNLGRPFKAQLFLGGLAAVGVVISHWFAYALAAPQVHLREALLESNGDLYFSAVIAVSFGLVVAGLARFASERRNRMSPLDTGQLIRISAPRLVAFQVVGFLVLEGTERYLAQGSIENLLTEPVVLIGVILQAAVALLGALKFAVIVTALAGKGSPEVPYRRASLPRAFTSIGFGASNLGSLGRLVVERAASLTNRLPLAIRAHLDALSTTGTLTMRKILAKAAWFLAASLLLTSCGGGSSTPGTTPSPSLTKRLTLTVPPSPPPSPTARVISVTVRSGKVETAAPIVEVPLGTRVRIEVTADVEDEVHVHSYDLKTPTKPGQTVTIEFNADIPGTFEVEIEERKLKLFELTVR